jgi:hypothetical protein
MTQFFAQRAASQLILRATKLVFVGLTLELPKFLFAVAGFFQLH